MSDFQPNIAIIEEFYEVNGVTSYSNGDFTKELSKDGATSAIPVTVAQISGARYSVTYTPDSVGLWNVRVYPTANDLVRYSQSRKVQTAVASQVWNALVASYAGAGSFGEMISLIYKWLRNRIVKSAATSGTYTLYDDDGTTPIATGTFSTTERTPN